MALQSKMTVYAAIVGVLAMMGGIVYYASLDNIQLEQAKIELVNVELRDIDTIQNQAKFDLTFLVTNPSDKTFTVSQINYQLFGDEVLLGPGQYSTADIALPGRAIFYSGAQVPLKNIFVLSMSDENSEIYNSMTNNQITNFSAEGSMTTETSWSVIEKEFYTEFENCYDCDTDNESVVEK